MKRVWKLISTSASKKNEIQCISISGSKLRKAFLSLGKTTQATEHNIQLSSIQVHMK